MATSAIKKDGATSLAILLAALVLLTATPAASAGEVGHGLYAELLSKYVKNGWVNYAGF